MMKALLLVDGSLTMDINIFFMIMSCNDNDEHGQQVKNFKSKLMDYLLCLAKCVSIAEFPNRNLPWDVRTLSPVSNTCDNST